MCFCFFFLCCRAHRVLHSFPTRRSSDLELVERLGRYRLLGRVRLRRRGRRPVGLLRWRGRRLRLQGDEARDRKSTRLNSSHTVISYAVFCLKKKNNQRNGTAETRENTEN